ncbi:unnamed protein product [Hydatigera taeniaeformis]|uniref:Secreted protein n=1 Tax=Hydatigena taeniaeformis TaxID=6205 RepID=A0A0R3WXP9_HYDTA|nr:unnamed protein product [Hydatigera taeniaeformis]
MAWVYWHSPGEGMMGMMVTTLSASQAPAGTSINHDNVCSATVILPLADYISRRTATQLRTPVISASLSSSNSYTLPEQSSCMRTGPGWRMRHLCCMTKARQQKYWCYRSHETRNGIMYLSHIVERQCLASCR